MKRKNLFAVILSVGVMALTFCGCMARSTDDLYALPKQSEAYYDLQRAIDGVMTGDAAYCAPIAGTNQQAVQLADLDGDGQEEAIVFLRTSGEVPLKIHVFDRKGEEYVSVAVIEGDGSSFESVEYADMDGNGGMELIFGRGLSGQVLRSLSAYTWREDRMVELMTVNYSQFRMVDLNGDERKEVFLLRDEAEEPGGVAELYSYRDGRMEREREAGLSVGVSAVRRIISGFVSPGVPAVFVASTFDETSIITDIFALRDQTFQNISASGETGLSTQTVRNYNAYATDIDNDGLIELPTLVALPSQDPEAGTDWIIDWYNLFPDGARQVKLSTFHNHSAGWYLELATEESQQPTGPVISSAFVCYDEEGKPYVWAEDGSSLEKRSVTLGQENFLLGTVEILEGLTPEDYIAFPDADLCVPGAPTTRTEPVDPTEEETGVN